MRQLLAFCCAALAMGGAALAETESLPSPASNWVLREGQFYAILLANWSQEDVTFIYRICQSDGPVTRISTREVQGQPVVLSNGQCVDVATQGSIRLTRANATSQDAASGTYQFIHATRNRST